MSKASKITLLTFTFSMLISFAGKSLANDNNEEPEDRVELTTSFIKGNKELPQTLYIVPWQEVKKVTKKQENMVLHSLYGDVFQPVTTKGLQQE